jgi:hypothetical protein
LKALSNDWLVQETAGFYHAAPGFPISECRFPIADSRRVSMPTRSASFKPPSLISKTNRESAIGNRGCGSYDEADETV